MNRSRRLLPLAPASLLVIGILAVPASAAMPRCFGQRATIVGTAGDGDAETEIACEADPEEPSITSLRRPVSARTPTASAIGMRSK